MNIKNKPLPQGVRLRESGFRRFGIVNSHSPPLALTYENEVDLFRAILKCFFFFKTKILEEEKLK